MDKSLVQKKIAGTSIFALVLAVVLLAGFGLAQAANNGKAIGHGDTRPGNGYGDTNHVHTGAPGQNR